MPSLFCLWNRPRLERWSDGGLAERAARSVSAHLTRCAGCRAEADRLSALRSLVRGAAPQPPDPEWSAFWSGVRVRIASEAPRPVREAWWLPLWKPVWGHPRLAMGAVGVVALALAITLGPLAGGRVAPVSAAPVVVENVSAADPSRSVMVYSNPDSDMTVIWVFSSETDDEA